MCGEVCGDIKENNIEDMFRFLFGKFSMTKLLKIYRKMDKAFFNKDADNVDKKSIVVFAQYLTIRQTIEIYIKGFLWII